jgi:hypothetical protein
MNDKAPMHSPATDNEPRARVVGFSDKPLFATYTVMTLSARHPGSTSALSIYQASTSAQVALGLPLGRYGQSERNDQEVMPSYCCSSWPSASLSTP